MTACQWEVEGLGFKPVLPALHCSAAPQATRKYKPDQQCFEFSLGHPVQQGESGKSRRNTLKARRLRDRGWWEEAQSCSGKLEKGEVGCGHRKAARLADRWMGWYRKPETTGSGSGRVTSTVLGPLVAGKDWPSATLLTPGLEP